MKKKTVIVLVIILAIIAFLIYRYFVFGYGGNRGKYSAENVMGVTDPFGFTGPGAEYDGYDFMTESYYTN